MQNVNYMLLKNILYVLSKFKLNLPCIYIANSRVGTKINIIGPPFFLYTSICTKPGNKYAIVFPDPVYAIPIKSCPDIIIGNTF